MFLYIFGSFNEKKEYLLSSFIHRYVLLSGFCWCELPGKHVKMQPVQIADTTSWKWCAVLRNASTQIQASSGSEHLCVQSSLVMVLWVWHRLKTAIAESDLPTGGHNLEPVAQSWPDHLWCDILSGWLSFNTQLKQPNKGWRISS